MSTPKPEKTVVRVQDRNTGRWRDKNGRFASVDWPKPPPLKPDKHPPRNKT